MPDFLYRLIFSFLKCKKKKLFFLCLKNFILAAPQFYIVDLGSVYGTYLKLKPRELFKMDKGQMFLIGSDTVFLIKEKISAVIFF